MKKLIFALALAFSGVSLAAGGGGIPTEQAQTKLSSKNSLQNGAKLFVNYCMGCHSIEYMRYQRLADDLELTEAQVENSLALGLAANGQPRKIGDTLVSAMDPADAVEWFGAKAPDLSVVSRSRGVDWLYTYLKSFYPDATRPTGWNNKLFENASMPNVLWELQGIQQPTYEDHDDGHGAQVKAFAGFEQVQAGSMSAEQYDAAVLDLVTFLEYVGEPAKLVRKSIGWKVMLFLALFTFLAYLLKVEYWRDVH